MGAEADMAALQRYYARRGMEAEIRMVAVPLGAAVFGVSARVLSPMRVSLPARRAGRYSVARADWPEGSNAALLSRQVRVSGGMRAR